MTSNCTGLNVTMEKDGVALVDGICKITFRFESDTSVSHRDG